ncbi:MAG: glycoside hydrolase family 2 protein [Phycisphaeraceae bacterium]|nr:glycoside hydrolase family 2 protein [Phycisphaeraceae bacterium]
MGPRHILDLAGDWRCRALPAPDGGLDHVPAPARAEFPVRLPGTAHEALIAAGLIRHPDRGFAELEQRWVGQTDWLFRRDFHLDAQTLAHDRIDLVLDRLDTIARIRINGSEVGQCASFFITHRLDARSVLRPGTNDIEIEIASPIRHILAERDRLGPRPYNGDFTGQWLPFQYVRKPACHFGWDWGPRIATSGIWGGVHLHAWTGARLASVTPRVRRADCQASPDAGAGPDAKPDGGSGRWHVEVACEIQWSAPVRAALHAELLRDGSPAASASADATSGAPGPTRASLVLEVDRPDLWWPRAHGDQPLYDLHVTLVSQDGAPSRAARAGAPADAFLDDWRGRIGFRTVSLDTSPDEFGERFAILVNDRPIFCTGANWIPDGLFPGDLSPARYRERIGQAASANMNMLRVWGGGMYEDRAFYDACDELGVLVWQDFMFACALYPEEEPLASLIEREAREQVSRLAAHPSVAMWCGGNECVWGYQKWGWKGRLMPGQTWGERYFSDVLPRAVAAVDGTRPYWPNSPASGDGGSLAALDAQDDSRGDRHTWDRRFEEVRKAVPRFVSEFGRQSPPALETLREALGAGELRVGSRGIEHRQRSTKGTGEEIDRAIRERLGQDPAAMSLEEWIERAQALQAEDLAMHVEWLRAHEGRCMGALVWQLNDCWTAPSWSLIDGAGRAKPALEAVRRAFAPRKK